MSIINESPPKPVVAYGSSRRNTELGLVILGAVVTVAAYVLASLGRTASIPADVGPVLAVLVVLLLIPHLATRVFAVGADATLLPIAALLNGIGWVFITRLRPSLGQVQATWTMVAVAAFIVTLVIVSDVRALARYRWTFAMIGISLLCLPFIPGLGKTIGDAKLWIAYGGFTFQPGEIAKLTLAIFFAGYLAERRELIATGRRFGPVTIPHARDLGPVIFAWATSLLIMIAGKDLGSSLMFFSLFVVVLWVATERSVWLVIGLVLFAGGAWFSWKNFGHVQTRVDTWLNPWLTPRGKGMQLVESTFSFSSGGVSGVGLGLGDPTRIPAAQTDFIIAAVGEELGLMGVGAILMSFMLLVGSGLRIAVRSTNTFSKLLAVGLTTIIGVQAFVIVGGVTRLVPLTGVTLPFVTYGGSSLVANYVLLALLLRISHETAAKENQLIRPVPFWKKGSARAARAAQRQQIKAEARALKIATREQLRPPAPHGSAQHAPESRSPMQGQPERREPFDPPRAPPS
jgi:cell division protein FtsW (lipid II flippase)